ncbi:hypothetical protein [Sporosarcina sp. P17b]|uniref:hypothetical protein n=1 Tax=Sporosarcina sp. P17b TaxID=2048260 RepID=UPI000C162B2F|nr:hypothetical protein [Sporosarcina sp. P17b]PIC72524.1 hypothetical protein CSV76_14940 [Sporosarcina sp. P17b]
MSGYRSLLESNELAMNVASRKMSIPRFLRRIGPGTIHVNGELIGQATEIEICEDDIRNAERG